MYRKTRQCRQYQCCNLLPSTYTSYCCSVNPQGKRKRFARSKARHVATSFDRSFRQLSVLNVTLCLPDQAHSRGESTFPAAQRALTSVYLTSSLPTTSTISRPRQHYPKSSQVHFISVEGRTKSVPHIRIGRREKANLTAAADFEERRVLDTSKEHIERDPRSYRLKPASAIVQDHR